MPPPLTYAPDADAYPPAPPPYAPTPHTWSAAVPQLGTAEANQNVIIGLLTRLVYGMDRNNVLLERVLASQWPVPDPYSNGAANDGTRADRDFARLPTETLPRAMPDPYNVDRHFGGLPNETTNGDGAHGRAMAMPGPYSDAASPGMHVRRHTDGREPSTHEEIALTRFAGSQCRAGRTQRGGPSACPASEGRSELRVSTMGGPPSEGAPGLHAPRPRDVGRGERGNHTSDFMSAVNEELANLWQQEAGQQHLKAAVPSAVAESARDGSRAAAKGRRMRGEDVGGAGCTRDGSVRAAERMHGDNGEWMGHVMGESQAAGMQRGGGRVDSDQELRQEIQESQRSRSAGALQMLADVASTRRVGPDSSVPGKLELLVRSFKGKSFARFWELGPAGLKHVSYWCEYLEVLRYVRFSQGPARPGKRGFLCVRWHTYLSQNFPACTI